VSATEPQVVDSPTTDWGTEEGSCDRLNSEGINLNGKGCCVPSL
jgi:hypothetical protein